MKIPFGWLPASWGLKGTSREIAEAEYSLTGYERDVKLAEIKWRGDPASEEAAKLHIDLKYKKITSRQHQTKMAHNLYSGDELACQLLHIDFIFGDITEYAYQIAVANIMVLPGVDLQLELLEIDHKFGKLTDSEFKKQSATARGEPYISVVDAQYDPNEKLNGLYFEFDWNDAWIVELKAAGYVGFTDDQLVQRWFADICRGVASEESNQLEEAQPLPFNSGRINQSHPPGGPTEYR